MDGHGQFHATIQRLEQQLQNLKDTRTDFWNRQWDLLFDVVHLKYKWANGESCFCLDKKKGCIPNCSNERWDWENEFIKDRGSLEQEIVQNRCQVKIPNENNCRFSYSRNSPPSWESQWIKAILVNFKGQCTSMERDLEVMDEMYHVILNSCPSPLNAQTQLLNQMLGFNTERMEQFNQLLNFPKGWSWMEWGFTVPGTKVLKCLATSHKQNNGYLEINLCTDFVYEKLVTKNGPFLSVLCGDGTVERALAGERLMGWRGVILTDLDETRTSSMSYPDVDIGYRHSLGKKIDHRVDATKLHRHRHLKDWINQNRADILFNCPSTVDEPGVLSKLICDVLASASRIQYNGSYVFIGITEREDDLWRDGITDVLKNYQYTLRYVDNGIINTVRNANGPHYHLGPHRTMDYIPDDGLSPDHVMLCFERNMSPPPQLSKHDYFAEMKYVKQQRLQEQQEIAHSWTACKDYLESQWELLFNIAALRWEDDYKCFCPSKKNGCIPNCSDQASARWEDNFLSVRQRWAEQILQDRYEFNNKLPTNSMTREIENMDKTCHIVLNSCPSPLNARTQFVNQLRIHLGWSEMEEWIKERDETFTVAGLKVLKCLAKSHKQTYGRAWYPDIELFGCGYGTFEGALVEGRPMGWSGVILTNLDETRTSSMSYPDVDIGYRPSSGKKIDHRVDATKLHCYGYVKDWVFQNRADILFNCPWRRGNGGVSKLICDFLTSASRIQCSGSFVFIGITENENYLAQYDIPNVVKNSANLYKLRHIDNGIIKTARHAKKPYRHFRYFGSAENFPENYVYPDHIML
ncbi:hypothetical protein HDU81_000432, partial [Chytriomyces hyalinus]